MLEHKTLEVFRIDDLDSKPLDEVSKYMELKLQKNYIDNCNWKDSYGYQPVVSFSICYSKEFIYVNYIVCGRNIKAVNSINNSPVHEDSCIEFFLKVPGSKEYWNFEFNCIGTIHASHRLSKAISTKLTDEQLSSVKRYSSLGDKSFDEKEGLFTWNVTIAIPLKLIKFDLSITPALLNANFYKCADKTNYPHFLSWSPILSEKPNFHCPEYFGNLIFK